MNGDFRDTGEVLARLADGKQPSKVAEYRTPTWWAPHARSLPGWRVFRSDDGLLRAWMPGTRPLVIVWAQTPDELAQAVRDELRVMDEKS